MSLMVPVCLFNGMTLAWLFGECTRNLVCPILGLPTQGYLLASFYAINAVCSYGGSRLAASPSFGRRLLFLLSFLLEIVVFAVVLIYSLSPSGIPHNYAGPHFDDRSRHRSPSVEEFIFVFGLVAVFAAGDSVLETQTPALLGSMFGERDDTLNAAMANFKMWQSLGFAAQFGLFNTDLISPSVGSRAIVLLGAAVIAGISMIALDRVQSIQ